MWAHMILVTTQIPLSHLGLGIWGLELESAVNFRSESLLKNFNSARIRNDFVKLVCFDCKQ